MNFINARLMIVRIALVSAIILSFVATSPPMVVVAWICVVIAAIVVPHQVGKGK